jgi:polyhydroxyalkanoate synthesis regulator phasin
MSRLEGDRLIDKLLSIDFKQDSVIENIEGKIFEFLKNREIPTRDDYKTLMNRIDSLSQKVEDLSEEDRNGKGSVEEN